MRMLRLFAADGRQFMYAEGESLVLDGFDCQQEVWVKPSTDARSFVGSVLWLGREAVQIVRAYCTG